MISVDDFVQFFPASDVGKQLKRAGLGAHMEFFDGEADGT